MAQTVGKSTNPRLCVTSASSVPLRFTFSFTAEAQRTQRLRRETSLRGRGVRAVWLIDVFLEPRVKLLVPVTTVLAF